MAKTIYELQYRQDDGRYIKSMTQKPLMREAIKKAIEFNGNNQSMNYRVVKKLGNKIIKVCYRPKVQP